MSNSLQQAAFSNQTSDPSAFKKSATVIVVGAGWAGLAAAVDLTRSGFKVTVLEQASHLGGRARGTKLRPERPLGGDETLFVDNGQHLLMGAYTESLGLIEWLLKNGKSTGSSLATLFERFPVHMRHVNGFEMRAAQLPAPLHLAWAWLTAKNLTLTERLAMGYFFAWLKAKRWLQALTLDISVDSLFAKTYQPASLIELLWRPLCLSALNTPPESASAKVFAAVLRDTLGANAQASDFLIAKGSLQTTLPDLAQKYLVKEKQSIQLGASVKTISAVHDGKKGTTWQVTTRNSQEFSADYLLLATPYSIAHELLATTGEPYGTTGKFIESVPANPTLQPTQGLTGPLQELPIATVYLYWRSSLKGSAQRPIMLAESPQKQQFGQWFFDLGPTAGGGRLGSVVISGPGPHLDFERQELAQLVNQQVWQQIGWIPADQAWTITEKRATFACTKGLIRPTTNSGRDGLFLCGDQYSSEYPATLETAVRSGLKTAAQIKERLKISQGA